MRTLNAVIDYNNIALKALFTCQYNHPEVASFNSDSDCAVLMEKLVTDVTMLLRYLSPDRVIFVCDSKNPWRNKIYDNIPGEKYKGTRVKDETKNWDKIYECFDNFKDILRDNGCIVSQIESAEADDLSALWVDKLYYKGGEDVILVSSDKDWAQQLRFSPHSQAFVIAFNPVSRNKGKVIYATDDFIDWLDSKGPVDLFFSGDDLTKKRIRDIMARDVQSVITPINPSEVLLEKVLAGDKGDNVPAFYEYYKNGKKTRVTELKSHHICTKLGIENIVDLEASVASGKFTEALEEEMKVKVSDISVTDRLARQRSLVELSPSLFPDSIVAAFETHFTSCAHNGYTDIANMKPQDILKGSKYKVNDFGKPKENSIFADIKGLDKFIKPLF